MTADLLLVFSNPVAGQDDAYNEWYDQQHVSDVLSVPGVVAAQRYELAPMKLPEADDTPTPPPPAHRYLAVYELDGDPDDVIAEFGRRVGAGEMALSESFDVATVSIAAWRPRGERRT